MKGSFFYALLEIKRRRTASFLIGLGVFIGTLSMLLLSAVGEGGSRQITAELTDTGILGLLIKRSDQSDLPGLSETELCALQSLPQVEKAAPILTVYGTVSAAGKEETCILWAATEGTEQAFSLKLLEGRLFYPGDLQEKSAVCLVDRVFALRYFGRENIVGKEVSVSLNGQRRDYRVVGTVSSGGTITQGILGSFVPPFLYLPYSTLTEHGGYSGFPQLAVSLQAENDRKGSIRQLIADLEKATGETGGYSYADAGEKSEAVSGILDTLSLTLLCMGLLTLLVAGMSIFLMMQSAVRERRIEIGIRIALGATGRQIAGQFVLEAATLAFLGGFLALLIAILILSVCTRFSGIDLSLSDFWLFFSVPLVTLFGSLCGLLPAKKAAACDPATAFKSL